MDRIDLGNKEFEGDNNVYVFDIEGSPTLIDAGVASNYVKTKLERELAELELEFSDIERIFLTHWHQDHIGLAKQIQELGNATVYIHEKDAPLVSRSESAFEQMSAVYEKRFEQWNMPKPAREELLTFLRNSDTDQYGMEVETFVGGDRFDVESWTFEVVHSPGHTAGLSGFYFDNDGSGSFLSGDALLPKYTPNVGGADIRMDEPLGKYIQTLNRIIGMDLDIAYPGHRDEIENPTERAIEILKHHEERAIQVLRILRQEGPLTAWETGEELFGDLSNIHIVHGPGEASAHLEHLRAKGLVVQMDGSYQITGEVVERLETNPKSVVNDIKIWSEYTADCR